MKVGIINYGSGNIASVYHSIKKIGFSSDVIERPEDLKNFEKLILPGVGNFSNAKELLDRLRWTENIIDLVLNKKIPLLGICLGMQLLAEWGFEGAKEKGFQKVKGLGLIEGEVKELSKMGCTERIPHMGWNSVVWQKSANIIDGISSNTDFYFVHSYGFSAKKPDTVVATVNYPVPITAIVAKNNIWGTQFHPEKSSLAGLRIIKNFIDKA